MTAISVNIPQHFVRVRIYTHTYLEWFKIDSMESEP